MKTIECLEVGSCDRYNRVYKTNITEPQFLAPVKFDTWPTLKTFSGPDGNKIAQLTSYGDWRFWVVVNPHSNEGHAMLNENPDACESCNPTSSSW